MKDYKLSETCSACPEQYDVFLDGVRVAYFRLRHGIFTVDVPDAGGETIYTAYPNGDGIFEAAERDYYIHNALGAVEKYYDSKEKLQRCRDEFDAALADMTDEEVLAHFPEDDTEDFDDAEKALETFRKELDSLLTRVADEFDNLSRLDCPESVNPDEKLWGDVIRVRDMFRNN